MDFTVSIGTQKTSTNSERRYKLNNIPTGTHYITVEKEGFGTSITRVVHIGGGNAPTFRNLVISEKSTTKIESLERINVNDTANFVFKVKALLTHTLRSSRRVYLLFGTKPSIDINYPEIMSINNLGNLSNATNTVFVKLSDVQTAEDNTNKRTSIVEVPKGLFYYYSTKKVYVKAYSNAANVHYIDQEFPDYTHNLQSSSVVELTIP